VVICSFRDRDTERLAARQRVKRWSLRRHKAALRKLRMLDAAEELTDLRLPPGNRLERPKGDRQGRHSICMNDQWRIGFRWASDNAYDVEIVHGKRAVTVDTALRRARYFATTPRFWLNLQAQYDLDVEADRLGDRLDREVAAHTS